MAVDDGVPGAVRIRGLKELRRAFKATGGSAYNNYMRKVFQRLAQRVVDASKPEIASESGSAAAAVTAIKSAVGGRIRLDGDQAPNLLGLVFGANQNRPRIGPTGRTFVGYNQFPQYDGRPRHIWPEVDDLRDEIADDVLKAIDQFFDSQGVPKA